MDDDIRFTEEILRGLSKVFELDYEDILQPEIVIRIRDDPDDANRIHLWYIGNKLVLRFDSNLVDKVSDFVTTVPQQTVPTTADFIDFYGKENISIDVYSSVHFLNPKNFLPFQIPSDFSIKSMSVEDKDDLDNLHSACTEYDVDE